MKFQEAIKTCLSKYADFDGRAKRSEYWWFYLFVILTCIFLTFINKTLGSIFYLGMILPLISSATRRLHDIGKSGWWQLIVIVPFVGILILLYLLAQDSLSKEAD